MVYDGSNAIGKRLQVDLRYLHDSDSAESQHSLVRAGSRTSTGALPPVLAEVCAMDNSFLGTKLLACGMLAQLQVSPCL